MQKKITPALEHRPPLSELTSTQLLARATQYRRMAADATVDSEAALVRVAVRLERMAREKAAAQR